MTIDSFQSAYGGFRYGDRNKQGRDLLDLTVTHDLGIINSFFKNKKSHLITFSSGRHNTQIDYFLMT